MRFLCFLFLIIGCTAKHEMNHLGKERSPYLQQHKDNLIWWYPWNKQALQHSEKNQKLIFLSVGYSTCHWCHVMEREVFEKKETAEVLNKYYVSIKVDREERPDLDAFAIKAQTGITRQPGWPISMVLTPDLKPVFAASYVPKKEFIYILRELQKAWQDKRDELHKRGDSVREWLNQKAKKDLSFDKDRDLFRSFYSYYTKKFDPIFGGKKGRTKFPINIDLQVLLRHSLHEKGTQALAMADKTLTTVAKSGLFDHLEGGFHRYSTDQRWQIPHFEKMLYDQASFLNAYVELYQLKQRPLHQKVIELTVQFLLKNFQSPQGGFYSAQDADTNHKEGLYYTWTKAEIEAALSDQELKDFNEYFFLTAPHKSIHKRQTLTKKSIFQNSKINEISHKLVQKRQKKKRPQIDKKVITAWNGLVLSALSKVIRLWPSQDMETLLKKHFDYLLRQHQTFSGELIRSSLDGHPSEKAIVDDYAFLIDALIEFYQTSFDESYLVKAYQLQNKQDELFYDNENRNYRLSTDNNPILSHVKTFQDSVRPSGQSMSFWNLLRLSHYFLDDSMKNKAKKLLDSYPDGLKTFPEAFPQLLLGIDFLISDTKELVVSGSRENCQKAANEIYQAFFPYLLFSCNSGGSKVPLARKKKKMKDKATYYVCEKGSCQNPTNSFTEAKKQILQQVN